MDHTQDLGLIREAARAAGEIAMSFFGQGPDVWRKSGGSPVSAADMAVDTYLRTNLTALRPDYGWVSEESDPTDPETDSGVYFVVDPIDGTRGFLAEDPRWAISVAIVSEARPVTAVLHMPALRATYWAGAGVGAWLDGTALAASSRIELSGARVAGPSAWIKSPMLADLKVETHAYVPSLAYRLALVAEDTVDGAFARPGSHDWDLAAADLLVHEAGGKLTGLDGRPLRYGRRPVRRELLVAAGGIMHGQLTKIVQEIADSRHRAGISL